MRKVNLVLLMLILTFLSVSADQPAAEGAQEGDVIIGKWRSSYRSTEYFLLQRGDDWILMSVNQGDHRVQIYESQLERVGEVNFTYEGMVMSYEYIINEDGDIEVYCFGDLDGIFYLEEMYAEEYLLGTEDK